MFDWTRGNLGFPPILNRSKNVDYFGSHCCCCNGDGCGWWWFGGCSGGRSRGGRCGSITTTGPTASRVYLIVPGAPPFVTTLSAITIFTTFCGKVSNKFPNSMKKNLHNIWSMRVYHTIYFEYYIIGVWLLWNYSDTKKVTCYFCKQLFAGETTFNLVVVIVTKIRALFDEEACTTFNIFTICQHNRKTFKQECKSYTLI